LGETSQGVEGGGVAVQIQSSTGHLSNLAAAGRRTRFGYKPISYTCVWLRIINVCEYMHVNLKQCSIHVFSLVSELDNGGAWFEGDFFPPQL
jgi:hypothetical protein